MVIRDSNLQDVHRRGCVTKDTAKCVLEHLDEWILVNHKYIPSSKYTIIFFSAESKYLQPFKQKIGQFFMGFTSCRFWLVLVGCFFYRHWCYFYFLLLPLFRNNCAFSIPCSKLGVKMIYLASAESQVSLLPTISHLSQYSAWDARGWNAWWGKNKS